MREREPDFDLPENCPRRVAFHEAGHVVVGWALGLEIGGTRIRPDGTGGADIAASDSLPLVDRVAIYMAGIVAAEMSGVEAVHEKEIWGDMGEVVSIGSREHPGDEFGPTGADASRTGKEPRAFSPCTARCSPDCPMSWSARANSTRRPWRAYSRCETGKGKRAEIDAFAYPALTSCDQVTRAAWISF